MKKVLSFSIAGLLVAILVATIITALVKSSFYYPIKNEEVMIIEVWKNGIIHTEYKSADENDAKIIEEILNLNKKGYEETVLASVFLNHYSHKTNVVSISTAINNIITSTLNEYVIILDFTNHYQENTKTLELFGKVYNDPNKTTGDATVQYKKMIFQVTKADTLGEITIYLENSTNGVPNLSSSLYQIKTLAKQDKLYNYLEYLTA